MIEKITTDKSGFKPRPRLHKLNPSIFEKIFRTLWLMKKDQLAELTVELTSRRLKLMVNSVNFDNAKEITKFLAKRERTIIKRSLKTDRYMI